MMLRALSTSRSRRQGYDRLLDEPSGYDGAKDRVELKRIASVPARLLFGAPSPYKGAQPPSETATVKAAKGGKKGGGKKSHPVFSLFDGGRWRKKKMTANPDFSRYLEYVKEGGIWNKDTNAPVIYYK